MTWLQKGRALVLVGGAEGGGEEGEDGRGGRKDGFLTGGVRGRGWKKKVGDEGDDRGEESADMVDGEVGETGSNPEWEEEEPETKTEEIKQK